MHSNTQDELAVAAEINRVLRRYCRAMDRIDAELGYTVWHPDGIADYGPLFTGTGRAFIDWVCDFHRTLIATSHMIDDPLIDVQGDQAVSETYVAVALLLATDSGHALTNGRGRYLDRWSCRAGVWAIDERRYVHDFDVTQDVQATVGWGTRDRADPSYQLLGVVGAA